MPSLRAVGVEQQIVKIPEHEVIVALGRSQAIAFGSLDLEKNLAVDQQCEKLSSGKAGLPPKRADFLWRGQQSEGGGDLRIAYPEQRLGARRFQHHLIAAPPQISEARQCNDVTIAELCRSRPIIGNLRLDDDLVCFGARGPEAIFQEAALGQ